MPLNVCFRCGGEFLPPSRAVHWRWCHPCSCEGSGNNPWDNPERDWSDWNMAPAEPFYGYSDDDPREPSEHDLWKRGEVRWPALS